MRTIRTVALWGLAVVGAAGIAPAREAAGPAGPAPGPVGGNEPAVRVVGAQHILSLLRGREGPVAAAATWALVACSVLSLTFILERLIVLRRSRVIPRTFVERFMDRLREGELERAKALELCRDNASPVANIFGLVVQNWGRPASEIRQAVTSGAESELFYLRRRIRGLNGMTTLAPLLGLFGTVIGMIRAFDALSQTGPGKTEVLSLGISLALYATAGGLAIAIVSAAAYYYLLSRVDELVQQMDVLAGEVIGHVSLGARSAEKAVPRPRMVSAREQVPG